MGTKGASVNVSKKGTRSTVGIPGSGLSFSRYSPHKTISNTKASENKHSDPRKLQSRNQQLPSREVSFFLGLGILFVPYIFSWLTLRSGYSTTVRCISFIWMFFVMISFF